MINHRTFFRHAHTMYSRYVSNRGRKREMIVCRDRCTDNSQPRILISLIYRRSTSSSIPSSFSSLTSADNKRLFKTDRNSLRSPRVAQCPGETMSRLSLLRHFIVVNPLMVAAFPGATGGDGRVKCFFLRSSHLFPVACRRLF